MFFKMKAIFSSFLLCVFALYLAYVTAEEHKKSCKTIVSELTKRQLNGISNCTKHMKFKNGKDKAQKSMCVMKCVLRNVLLLNEENKGDKKTLEDFVNTEFPDKDLQDRAHPLFQSCLETAAKTIDPAEEFCKSYDPYIKCLTTAVLTTCPG